jgi:hypothetical protein
LQSNTNFVNTIAFARSKKPELKAAFMASFLNQDFVWYRGCTIHQMELAIEWKISKNRNFTETFLAGPCSLASTALLEAIEWDALNIVNKECGEPQKNMYPLATEPPLGKTQEDMQIVQEPSGEQSIASSMIVVQEKKSEAAVKVAGVQAASEERIAALQVLAAGGAAAETLTNQVKRRQAIVKELKRYILQVKKHVLVKTIVDKKDVWQVKQPFPTNSDPQIMKNQKVLGCVGVEFEEEFNQMGKHLVALDVFVQQLGCGTCVNDAADQGWLNFETYAEDEESALLTIQTWNTNCKKQKEEFDPSNDVAPGPQFTSGLVEMFEYY